MSEKREAAEKALEQLVRAAMGSGVACFTERLRAGKVDPAAPISEAFGDFPREFIEIRQGLVDDVLDAVTPLIRAEVLREAERAITDAAPRLGAELRYDGTEDPLMAAYLDGFREASQVVDLLANPAPPEEVSQ